MKGMPDNSADAIVTDPPYELTSITKRYGKKNCKPCGSGKDGSFRRLSKGFMGKEWDATGIAMSPEVWRECLRVAKPGAFLLSFGGTRTFHRIACATEDAGWVMINTMNWLYGSGFPKNADISKGMDKSAGARRKETTEPHPYAGRGSAQSKQTVNLSGSPDRKQFVDAPVTPEAERWDGFGTALKPAWEPVLLFQKPIEGAMTDEIREITGWKRWYVHNGRWSWEGDSEADWKKSDVYEACKKYGLEWWEEKKDKDIERFIYRRRWDALVPHGQGRHSLIGKNGRVVLKRWPYRNKKRVNNVANVLKWGVGGLNLGGCKIGNDPVQINRLERWSGFGQEKRPDYTPTQSKGRWPSNTILSHSLFCEDGRCVNDCPIRMLDEQSGELKSHGGGKASYGGTFGSGAPVTDKTAMERFRGDKGGASRFFYCTKVMPKERNAGLAEFEDRMQHRTNSGGIEREKRWAPKITKNDHPTIKPIPLLRYLCRLVCPPGGTILDMFMGSGSTGCAAALEGLDFVGIEKEKDYFKIAEARIQHFKEQYDADRK
jgi:DNA modification methylase